MTTKLTPKQCATLNRYADKQYRGVTRTKTGTYQAAISTIEKVVYLGTYKEFEAALIAYNQAAMALYGAGASLNSVNACYGLNDDCYKERVKRGLEPQPDRKWYQLAKTAVQDDQEGYDYEPRHTKPLTEFDKLEAEHLKDPVYATEVAFHVGACTEPDNPQREEKHFGDDVLELASDKKMMKALLKLQKKGLI